jgi:hypothetical protein
VSLTAVPGRPRTALSVEDDSPEGFRELAHAYTLFAESYEKGLPEKRGRFNLGEKLVLAMCEEATISTTTGAVHFDAGGTRALFLPPWSSPLQLATYCLNSRFVMARFGDTYDPPARTSRRAGRRSEASRLLTTKPRAPLATVART